MIERPPTIGHPQLILLISSYVLLTLQVLTILFVMLLSKSVDFACREIVNEPF